MDVSKFYRPHGYKGSKNGHQENVIVFIKLGVIMSKPVCLVTSASLTRSGYGFIVEI